MSEINRITPMKDTTVTTDTLTNLVHTDVYNVTTTDSNTSIAPNSAITSDDAAYPIVKVTIVTSDGQYQVDIESFSIADIVQSFKQYLSEYFTTGYYTNYSLRLDTADDKVILNDFVELEKYLTPDIISSSGNHITITMVDEMYDLSKAREHVKKVRQYILYALSYIQDVKQSTAVEKISNDKIGTTTDTHASPTAIDDVKKDTHGSKASKNKKKKVKSNPVSSVVSQVASALPPVSVWNEDFLLSDFYKNTVLKTGKPNELYDKSTSTSKLLSDCVKGIVFSGWNPVPLQRQMQGDVLYLEINLEESIYHITSTINGFYVNKSTRHNFDPTPAVNAHFSHSLFKTLLSLSSTLLSSWTHLYELKSKDSSNSAFGALDDIANSYAQGRGDLLSINKPQWNVVTENIVHGCYTSSHHTYSVTRSEDDLCSGFEEKGTSRDWNEEYQTIRALPEETVDEKLQKARLMVKIVADYADTCKQFLYAICEGRVIPVNSMDGGSNGHVYVFNNIFASRAVEMKESFKICKGDIACRKTTSHDMNNLLMLQASGMESINNVLQCNIDYKGDRFVFQCIIPGVMQCGDSYARLMYGCLESDTKLTCKSDTFPIVKKILSKFYITPRNINRLVKMSSPSTTEDVVSDGDNKPVVQNPIHTDDDDELMAPTDTVTQHAGPIEMKIIKGSDGRLYALEVARLTPRDANYVSAGNGGTDCINKELLDKVDGDVATTYLIRSSLIEAYVDNEVKKLRKEVVDEATKKKLTTNTAAVTASDATDEKKVGGDATTSDATTYASAAEDDAVISKETLEKIMSISKDTIGLEINPNAFIDGSFHDIDAAVAEKDKETVREMSKYLYNIRIPEFLHQLIYGSIIPHDNESLIDSMHGYGINVRYLGYLIKCALKYENSHAELKQDQQMIYRMPPYVLEMLEVEVLARSLKHYVGDVLRSNASINAAPASMIATIINCIFGNCVTGVDDTVTATATHTLYNDSTNKTSKKSKKSNKKSGTIVVTDHPSMHADAFVTSKQELLTNLKELFVTKYGCDETSLINVTVGSDASAPVISARINKYTLLRRICQQIGCRVLSRDYDFNTSYPFKDSDVIAMTPTIVSCEPTQPLALVSDLLKACSRAIQEGAMQVALENAIIAHSLMQQVTGDLHKEYLYVLEYVTTTLSMLGDMPNAIAHISKSIQVAVQLFGIDSSNVLQQHLTLSDFYFDIGNVPQALAHLSTSKYLATLMGGNNHPEITNIYLKLASMYSSCNEHDNAILLMNEVLARATDLYKEASYIELYAAFLSKSGNADRNAHSLQMQAVSRVDQLYGEGSAKSIEARATLTQYHRKCIENNVQVAKAARESVNTKQVACATTPSDSIVGATEGKAVKSNRKK